MVYKGLKLLTACAALVALSVALAPQPGVCGMSSRSVVACSMPCCRRPMGKATCPLIRPAAARDSITPSGPVPLVRDLKIVYVIALKDFLTTLRPFSRPIEFIDPRRSVFELSPQVGPAPPHLA